MKHFKAIFLNNRGLVIAIFLSGIFVSLMEGLGLSLVLPLLEGANTQIISNISFPFDRISAFFSGMSIVERIRLVVLFLVIATFFKSAALYLNNISICRLQIAVMKYYRMKCAEQLMKVGMSYINKQKSAHLQTISIAYTQALGALANAIGSLVTKIFTVVVLITMLVLLSWKMTIISFFIVILASVLLRGIAIRAEKAGKKFSESLKNINHAMLNILSGMKVIRLFRRENDMTKGFEYEVDYANASMLSLVKARGSVQPIFEMLGVFSLAVILIVGSFLLLPGSDKEGLAVVLTFILIFFRVLSPALEFNQTRVAIKGDSPCYREVHELLETQDKPYISSGRKVLDSFQKNIEFYNIDFAYNPKEAIVLQKVSFKINKGTKIGIVGPSGCGKSTAVELLLRFYDPQEGKILVDGVNLKDLDLYSWRRCVGVVTQDTFLFPDTVRANIAYAKPDATREQIEQAAKRAYAHNFILELPQGYDTFVGERGVLLSGGQKQRLAIARAIIMDPDILVFDEATSALDTESEEIVQKALYDVGKDKTVITIAHRLSTIFNSDNIIVIETGRIIQQGTHNVLLKQGGLYSKLVQMQAMESQNEEHVLR